MGESDSSIQEYRTIGPMQLENRIGRRAAMFFQSKRHRENRIYTVGDIDYNSDGVLCLRADGEGHGELIEIQHGDAIRIRANGKGFNSIREYIFIDDSD